MNARALVPTVLLALFVVPSTAARLFQALPSRAGHKGRPRLCPPYSRAALADEGIELRWRLGDSRAPSDLILERSPQASGPWARPAAR